MSDDLQNAIGLYKTGKKTEAGAIFARIVKANPNNEQAWLGLSACIVPEEQKKYCLNQVLRINPQNEHAKKTLAGLEFKPVFEAPIQDKHASNVSQVQSPRPQQFASKSRKYSTANNTVPKDWSTVLRNIYITPQTALKIAATLIIIISIILGINWVGNNVGTEIFYGHPVGYSWNNLATIEQGGVSVEIARLAVYNKSSLSKQDQKAFATNRFRDLNTICNLYFRITNNSDRIMSIYPTSALIMVNNEQVQSSYSTSGTLSGEIFPGATVTGIITFGLKNITPNTINNMRITFSRPHDNYFDSYGQDYVFYLDLSAHKWLDKPDELK
jgi:hypothetical protein